MIGNAHIDPVWLWHWQEGYAEVRATFRSALDRMNEFDEFVFTMNQVVFLAWVEEHDPPMFAEIAERVRQGRWEIVGGMWVEPDCNIPSGESFVRHTLYSQRYLQSRFGLTATVGLNADPFGHNAMLPQLLARSGMDSYLFLRPQAHEMTLPAGAFRWAAPDGSAVLAARIPNEYGSPPREVTGQVAKSLAQLPPTDRPLVCFYGVGNHGGGPTRANISSIRELAARDGTPPLAPATARSYFDAAAADPDIATIVGELQMHAVGCYSAQSEIKRNNRRGENALRAAEKWATLAARFGVVADVRAELEHAWKQLLFNQFHDILPGSALPDTYRDARDSHGEVAAIAARVANRSIQSIARQIDTSADAGTVPLMVFNPHAFDVTETVELELGGFPGPVGVTTAPGNPVAAQEIRSESVTGGRRRYAIRATVPALGYATFRFGSDFSIPDPPVPPTALGLENERLRAVVDPRSGWLSSLVHLPSGTELMPPAPSEHAVILADATDTWGHGVRSFRNIAGHFTPRRVERIHTGRVREAIRVISTYRTSTLTEEIRLDSGAGHLEVAVTIDWREQLTAVKLRFPAALTDAVATHEIPYGYLVRPAEGQEVPSQNWVDVTGRAGGGDQFGLALLNDGKYSFDVTGSEIGMMALRSPAYAWHDPALLQPDEQYRYQDQGIQRFRYRLLPHAGDWRAADVPAAGAILNEPMTALLDSNHPGVLPTSQSLGAVRAGTVMITVIKTAEDDADTVVLRAYETDGAPTTAEFHLPFLERTITADFAACEIKTLLVPRDPQQPVVETNLLEWIGTTTPDRV